MLERLLLDRRIEILALTERMTERLSGPTRHSKKLAEGLPLFYSALLKTFQNAGTPMDSRMTGGHGTELFKLGYTVTQVVNAYGALCQAITETAEKLGTRIGAREFSILNATLDRAIAEAVSEFEAAQTQDAAEEHTRRFGSLVNQLRTCTETAILAHASMKQGLVGTAGSTNALLERNLLRMADLIDGAVTDIRLRSEPQPLPARLRLVDVVAEVEIVASAEGRTRDVSLSFHVDPRLEVFADRNHAVSTLANLLQNAVKFSRSGGVVVVRAIDKRETVAVEVEDQCGGLPKGRIEELFRPFSQKGADRSGAGLGLALSRRAMELNKGSLTAVDLPGKGCVFTFTLPKPTAARADARSPGSRRARAVLRGRAPLRVPSRRGGRRGHRKTSARPLARR